MTKQNIKYFVAGVLVATVGITGVFAASAIKSAQFNANKVVYDGKTLDLSANPMISVVKEGETAFSNYMPVRAILEQMGYKVDWDGATSTVTIASKAEEVSTKPEAEKETTQIANPWIDGTVEEAYKKVGAEFTITPPEGYSTAASAAYLDDKFVTAESPMTIRLVYTNAAGDMYRVHIHKGAEVVNQGGEKVEANGLTGYYDKNSNSIEYADKDYAISIDMLGASADTVKATLGSVKVK